MATNEILTPEQEEIDQESFDAVKDRIEKFDFAKAASLLDILGKVASTGPQNNAIVGLAQALLKEMNDEAREIARLRNEAKLRAEAELAERQRQEQEVADDEVDEVDDDNDGINDETGEPVHRPVGAPRAAPRAIPSNAPGRRV